jgi:hypothetical protein
MIKKIAALAGTTATIFISRSSNFSVNEEIEIPSSYKFRFLSQFTKITGIKIEADQLIFKPKSLRFVLKQASISYPPDYSPDDFEAKEAHDSLSDFTHYSLIIEQATFKPSLLHFLQGKGWIKQAQIQGVQGDLDKRWILPRNVPWKYTPSQGDFVIDGGISIQDCSLNVHYSNLPDPVHFYINKGHCPVLRKRWLLHDFLSSNSELEGIYHFNSPFRIKDGNCFIENLPLLHIKSSNSNPFAADSDPLEALEESLVDIKAQWKDKHHFHGEGEKDFKFQISLKNCKFNKETVLHPLGGISFTHYLNETRPSFALSAAFSLPLTNFYCTWSHHDAGITNSITHQTLNSYTNLIRNRKFQLEMLKGYSIWRINSIFSPKRNFAESTFTYPGPDPCKASEPLQ